MEGEEVHREGYSREPSRHSHEREDSDISPVPVSSKLPLDKMRKVRQDLYNDSKKGTRQRGSRPSVGSPYRPPTKNRGDNSVGASTSFKPAPVSSVDSYGLTGSRSRAASYSISKSRQPLASGSNSFTRRDSLRTERRTSGRHHAAVTSDTDPESDDSGLGTQDVEKAGAKSDDGANTIPFSVKGAAKRKDKMREQEQEQGRRSPEEGLKGAGLMEKGKGKANASTPAQKEVHEVSDNSDEEIQPSRIAVIVELPVIKRKRRPMHNKHGEEVVRQTTATNSAQKQKSVMSNTAALAFSGVSSPMSVKRAWIAPNLVFNCQHIISAPQSFRFLLHSQVRGTIPYFEIPNKYIQGAEACTNPSHPFLKLEINNLPSVCHDSISRGVGTIPPTISLGREFMIFVELNPSEEAMARLGTASAHVRAHTQEKGDVWQTIDDPICCNSLRQSCNAQTMNTHEQHATNTRARNAAAMAAAAVEERARLVGTKTRGKAKEKEREWENDEDMRKNMMKSEQPSEPKRAPRKKKEEVEDKSQQKISFGAASTSAASQNVRIRRSGRISNVTADFADRTSEEPVEVDPPLSKKDIGPPVDKNELYFLFPPRGRADVSITQGDLLRIKEGEFLNDTLLEFGLRYTLSQLPTEMRDAVHLFNSFFYGKLSNKTRASKPTPDGWPAYDSVRRWTRNERIFDKKFIVVPINENFHWYLAVIFNPKGVLRNKPSEADKEASPAPDTEAALPTAPPTPSALQNTVPIALTPPPTSPRPSGPDQAVNRALTRLHFSSPGCAGDISMGSRDEINAIDQSDDEGLWNVEGGKHDMKGVSERVGELSLAARSGSDVELIDDTREKEKDELHPSDREDESPGAPIMTQTLSQYMRQQEHGRAPAAKAMEEEERVEGNEPDREEVNEEVDELKDDPEEDAPPAAIKGKAAVDKGKVAQAAKKKKIPAVKPDVDILCEDRAWIITFDSLGGDHKPVGKVLNMWLHYEARDKMKVDYEMVDAEYWEGRVPQQPNFYDCGLFVVHYAAQLLTRPDEILRFIQRRPCNSKHPNREEYEIALATAWHADGTRNLRETWESNMSELASQYVAAKFQMEEDARAAAEAAGAAGAGEGEGKGGEEKGGEEEMEVDEVVVQPSVERPKSVGKGGGAASPAGSLGPGAKTPMNAVSPSSATTKPLGAAVMDDGKGKDKGEVEGDEGKGKEENEDPKPVSNPEQPSPRPEPTKPIPVSGPQTESSKSPSEPASEQLTPPPEAADRYPLTLLHGPGVSHSTPAPAFDGEVPHLPGNGSAPPKASASSPTDGLPSPGSYPELADSAEPVVPAMPWPSSPPSVGQCKSLLTQAMPASASASSPSKGEIRRETLGANKAFMVDSEDEDPREGSRSRSPPAKKVRVEKDVDEREKGRHTSKGLVIEDIEQEKEKERRRQGELLSYTHFAESDRDFDTNGEPTRTIPQVQTASDTSSNVAFRAWERRSQHIDQSVSFRTAQDRRFQSSSFLEAQKGTAGGSGAAAGAWYGQGTQAPGMGPGAGQGVRRGAPRGGFHPRPESHQVPPPHPPPQAPSDSHPYSSPQHPPPQQASHTLLPRSTSFHPRIPASAPTSHDHSANLNGGTGGNGLPKDSKFFSMTLEPLPVREPCDLPDASTRDSHSPALIASRGASGNYKGRDYAPVLPAVGVRPTGPVSDRATTSHSPTSTGGGGDGGGSGFPGVKGAAEAVDAAKKWIGKISQGGAIKAWLANSPGNEGARGYMPGRSPEKPLSNASDGSTAESHALSTRSVLHTTPPPQPAPSLDNLFSPPTKAYRPPPASSLTLQDKQPVSEWARGFKVNGKREADGVGSLGIDREGAGSKRAKLEIRGKGRRVEAGKGNREKDVGRGGKTGKESVGEKDGKEGKEGATRDAAIEVDSDSDSS